MNIIFPSDPLQYCLEWKRLVILKSYNFPFSNKVLIWESPSDEIHCIWESMCYVFETSCEQCNLISFLMELSTESIIFSFTKCTSHFLNAYVYSFRQLCKHWLYRSSRNQCQFLKPIFTFKLCHFCNKP